MNEGAGGRWRRRRGRRRKRDGAEGRREGEREHRRAGSWSVSLWEMLVVVELQNQRW
jgi:hypothetical protein